MSALGASPEVTQDVGRWRVWATRPGYERTEVTYVRGFATTVGDWTWSDPFGPGTASLTFPAVTMYDRVGHDDLFWLAPEVDFDIEWAGELPAGYPYERWVWEGYSLPFEYSQDEVTINLLGALMQMDDVLAKPEYLSNPVPYEAAIARCWKNRADLRVKNLDVVFPPWWTKRYVPKAKELGAFTPTGVVPGSYWTGLVTRETGSWDKTLTSYIQTMLASMYTIRGRWTIDLLPDRRPRMFHRDFQTVETPATVVIEPTQPGVDVKLSEDWSQSANVWYGQSTALTGEAYSGQVVIQDGQRTVYKPLAALRQVEPVSDRNTWLEPGRMRREAKLQVQDGLQADELIQVGISQLQTTADPGVTGSVTLKSDPRMSNGTVIPRHLIRAGMSLAIRGFKGDPDGVLVHVTEARCSLAEETVTLTVDSKYRDKLTVDEVRLRGRDALNVPRLLITGKQAALLPDSLFPWNYAEGSGYIPSSPSYNARRLFEDIDEDLDLTFPYQDLTTRRPPRSASWKNCYIRIGPADLNEADKNWAVYDTRGGRYGFPIRMAQAGNVRSLQLAAYNADGEVMPVGFHFSIYYQRDVNVAGMPKIPAGRVPTETSYSVGDHYPFFRGAWESFNELGVNTGIEVPVSTKSSGLIRGYGTETVRAGYWPGTSAGGDAPTGLLVDEGTWEWNTVGQVGGEQQINPFAYNDVGPSAGYLYCMVYCDRQLEEDVYFLGRMFRVEPGQQT